MPLEDINMINSINMTKNIDTEIIYAVTHSISMEILLHLEIPSVIAISGKMGTGKDTVYKILEVIAKMKGETIENFKFAKVLKEIVAEIEQVSVKDLENPQIKMSNTSKLKNGGSLRDTLVLIGTKIREINPDYFVNNLSQEICNYSNANINVITDLRFKNELKEVTHGAISNLNRVIWRINRANISTSTDISETDLDDYSFEYVIWNNSSITDLVKDVIALLIHYSNEKNSINL